MHREAPLVLVVVATDVQVNLGADQEALNARPVLVCFVDAPPAPRLEVAAVQGPVREHNDPGVLAARLRLVPC